MAAITVVATFPIAPGLAAAAPAPAGEQPQRLGQPAWQGGAAATVTLITGDRVLVGAGQDGQQAVQVLPAQRPGRRVAFRTWQSGSDTYVVPSDVDRLVPKVLDLALFNVSDLVAAGLDDANSSAIPLLVQHEAGKSPAVLDAGGALPATRELSSIHASATRLDKQRATDLGQALATVTQEAARSGIKDRVEAGPLAGVQHVWLDAPVRALLDPNLTQIGAPAAWNRGLSGSGVKVAVLDTGIDGSHPDLAGQVVAEANFTTSPDAVDRIGHGTHVAAIAAGTGVQSGNERKGVAFGARLLNGKVIGEDGSGTVSDAIAGMEWAVAQGADIVNMSIGVLIPTDGTDPWSQAVNQLTQSSGALFVVAAGNTGPNPVEISPPATADAALTVGAVDSANRPASFSSRGPRLGDYALKPEISAPGVDIISARAAGTTLGIPVDDRYVRASGTSMATPHVAGAAALLVQQHPDWTPAQLKAALVGTAQPAPGVSGYAQGGGRVDLTHLIDQRLFADLPAVDFRSVPGNGAPATRTVTLRNTGTVAVTVNAALSVQNAGGQPAPGGLFSVSPAQVSVPAGGTRTVTVTLRPSATAAGEYSGGLTLTPNSGRVLRLPVAGFVTPPTVSLTLRGIDRAGNPYRNGTVQLYNVDNYALTPVQNPQSPGTITLDDNGEATIQAVTGTYSTMSTITDFFTSASLVGSLQTTINQNTTIVLDARAALPASATVDGIGNQSVAAFFVGYTRIDRFGRRLAVELGSGTGPGNPTTIPLFIQPTAAVTIGSVETRAFWRVNGNDADSPAEVALPFVETGFRNPPQYRVTAAELASYAQVEAEYRAFGNAQLDYGVGQGIRTPQRGFDIVVGSTGLTFPLARTEYFRTDSRLSWFQCVIAFLPFGPPVDQHCELNLVAHPAGERSRKQWLAAPLDPVLGVTRTADQLNIVNASPHGDGDGRTQSIVPVIGLIESSFQVYRDGVPFGNVGAIWVPTNRPSAIRVEGIFDLDPNALPVPSSTHVTWAFTTSPPPGSVPVVPPVLLADVHVPGLDNRNFAPAGQALAVEVNPHTAPGATAPPIAWVEFFVTSDNGQNWTWVTLTRGQDGRYRGQIPAQHVIAGGAIGTRVRAGDSGSSTVEATQLHAVRMAG